MDAHTYKISKENLLYHLLNLRQLTFEVTDGCNLSCRYCGYSEIYDGHDKRESKNMPIAKAIVILDYLMNIWNNSSEIEYVRETHISFYGGEPLLNITFINEVVKYIEDHSVSNRDFVFSMTTNAMLLNKYMDFLVEKRFNLLISLDGDKRAHSYRIDHSGYNSFDQVFRNVKLLRDTYPEYFEKYVSFNSVLNSCSEVEGVHKFIYDNFGKTPSINELNNFGVNEAKIDEYNFIRNSVLESLNKVRNYKKISDKMFLSDPYVSGLSTFLQRISGNFFLNYNNLLFNSDRFARFATGTCLPFQKKMFVTVNGKIIQCERIDHKYALGEVTEDGVSLDLDEIANRFNERIESIQHLCKLCAGEKVCSQCIYYIDNLGQKNIKCNGFMNKERFEAYKQSNMSYLARYPHLYKKLMEDVLIDY